MQNCYVRILTFTLMIMLAGCVSKNINNDRTSTASRSPRFVVETDASGEKIVYPFVAGVADRRQPIRTVRSGWHIKDPAFSLVACYTFQATQTSTGATVCGVTCTDGTIYRMNCGADIFADGFDIHTNE